MAARPRVMQSLVRRAILRKSALEISVARDELNRLLGMGPAADANGQEDHTITVPARLKSRGANELMDGSVKTQREIAAREALPERYVRRVLGLAFLAPDITEAILDGRQPETLTLEDLVMGGNLPPDWAQQRRRLGML